MKKVMFLSLVLMLGNGVLKGQEVILDFPEMRSETSIVRQYPNNYDIALVYSYTNGDTTNHFFIGDLRNYSFRAVPFIPNAIVSDFEFVGDYVLFCGSLYGKAMFGFFNIQPLLTSTGNVIFNYCQIPSTTISKYDTLGNVIYSTTANHTQALKIDAYQAGSGFQAFLVVEAISNNSTTYHREVINIAGSSFSGIYQYKMAIYSDPTAVDFFSDVAVTQDYVAFVSHKNTGTGLYLHSVPRSNLASTFFLPPPFSIYDLFSNVSFYNWTESEPIVESIKENTIAVAFYGHTNQQTLVNPGTDIMTFDLNYPNSQATLLNHNKTSYGTLYNHNAKMYELKCIPGIKTLSLLHHAPTSNTQCQNRFDEYSNHAQNTTVHEIHDNDYTYFSSDAFSNDRFILSGIGSGSFDESAITQKLYVHVPFQASCTLQYTFISSILGTNDPNYGFGPQDNYYYGTGAFNITTYSTPSFPIQYKIICNSK